MKFFTFYLFVFKLLINWTKADEAAALCAFVNATNINSIYNEWSCNNTENRCSWPKIICYGTGSIAEIDLAYYDGKHFNYN